MSGIEILEGPIPKGREQPLFLGRESIYPRPRPDKAGTGEVHEGHRRQTAAEAVRGLGGAASKSALGEQVDRNIDAGARLIEASQRLKDRRIKVGKDLVVEISRDGMAEDLDRFKK